MYIMCADSVTAWTILVLLRYDRGVCGAFRGGGRGLTVVTLAARAPSQTRRQLDAVESSGPDIKWVRLTANNVDRWTTILPPLPQQPPITVIIIYYTIRACTSLPTVGPYRRWRCPVADRQMDIAAQKSPLAGQSSLHIIIYVIGT